MNVADKLPFGPNGTVKLLPVLTPPSKLTVEVDGVLVDSGPR